MTKKTIKGLKEIYDKYDAFFIDLWGVIHNGIELYSGAIEVLENLYKLNKRFVLMSNAPRPSKNVEQFLLNLKMDKIFAKNIFTSGEAALKSLQKNVYGKNFYHIGPKRDNSLFKKFEKNKTSLKEADFILCTGFLDNHEESLGFYFDKKGAMAAATVWFSKELLVGGLGFSHGCYFSLSRNNDLIFIVGVTGRSSKVFSWICCFPLFSFKDGLI